MKRVWVLAVAGFSAWLLSAAVVQAAEVKIGVVNFNRLLAESPQGKAAQEALRSELAVKQREMTTLQTQLKTREDKLTKDAATMTADQRSKAEKELRDSNRDYQAKVTEYQDDLNARQNEELSRVQAELVTLVQNYAAAQKFDIVLAEGVIYANNTIDITGAVLAALPAAAAKPAAAPSKPPAK